MREPGSDEADEAVVARVQSGDTDAFGIIVERYGSKMTRYAQKFLYTYTDREDAVQDTFLKAYQNIQSFRTSERFSPWLYRIAHNTFLNVIRKQKRERVSLFDMDQFFAFSIPDADELYAREQKLDRDMLESSLKELPVHYREVLVLFYFEEKTYEEIADILHTPVSTVGVRLARARTQLKTIHTRYN